MEMQEQTVIIIRYGEIYLKKKNRGYFERIFRNNIEAALQDIPHQLEIAAGRYYIENFEESDTEKLIARLKKVFGIHTMSIGKRVKSDMNAIFYAAKAVCRTSGSFKVETHRADKKFPLDSMQISREIGGRLLSTYKTLTVDVHNPDFYVYLDVRENGTTLVFSEFFDGAKGMPVGTAGKGLLLLSGGIDSPVAGYMMAKRGMHVHCLHFHSYPYTNMQAKEKVVELAKIFSPYTCGTRLFCVSVTHIQEEIHQKCAPELMVTLLRRFMYRIAEIVANRNSLQCIITGESLGQVASQTIEGMTSSNSVVKKLPVLRPLVGFDKNEIIEKSMAMGTYETSILPYEDCCTVFLPKFPAIRPQLDYIESEEAKLDVYGVIEEALKTLEKVEL
ncbi:MAG: tRNA 4-thiouridine(8) synthase ThiI [Clostridia bacterium]|nr:tRNA 4-thiouridine(8) synthase ThiI [Clostridia bacterium]